LNTRFGIVLLAAVMFCGCETQPKRLARATADPSRPIRVVATVGMVADIVRNVGGDRVIVTQLMGPGVDPHLYKGTRDDVRAILASDMVFYSGLMLEGKLTDMLKKVSDKRPVVAVTDSLDRTAVLSEADNVQYADPHVWMDVSLWSQSIAEVADALSRFDSSNEARYRAAAAAYEATLVRLHEYGKGVIASVPTKGRVLITSHDAFAYFGRAYGVDVYGVQGLSTDSEAGLSQINSLVDTIVDRGVAAVFVESSVPQKSIMAVVDGAASRGHRVIIGGELFSDAMGAAKTYEGTYVGMLDHNLTLVARGLGGTAPPGGMQGHLNQGIDH